MRDALLSAAKGAAIGGTMLIPGVSGGTTAMMLGIYDRLIHAVSGFRRHKRESFFFLLWFCLGACAGIFLLARPQPDGAFSAARRIFLSGGGGRQRAHGL